MVGVVHHFGDIRLGYAEFMALEYVYKNEEVTYGQLWVYLASMEVRSKNDVIKRLSAKGLINEYTNNKYKITDFGIEIYRAAKHRDWGVYRVGKNVVSSLWV